MSPTEREKDTKFRLEVGPGNVIILLSTGTPIVPGQNARQELINPVCK